MPALESSSSQLTKCELGEYSDRYVSTLSKTDSDRKAYTLDQVKRNGVSILQGMQAKVKQQKNTPTWREQIQIEEMQIKQTRLIWQQKLTLKGERHKQMDDSLVKVSSLKMAKTQLEMLLEQSE